MQAKALSTLAVPRIEVYLAPHASSFGRVRAYGAARVFLGVDGVKPAWHGMLVPSFRLQCTVTNGRPVVYAIFTSSNVEQTRASKGQVLRGLHLPLAPITAVLLDSLAGRRVPSGLYMVNHAWQGGSLFERQPSFGFELG